MKKPEDSIAERKAPILWRGIRGRCPKCGAGKLFKSYLKPNESCPACGEDLSEIRADDGPAWLTILLAGHIVVPLTIFFTMQDVLPEWATMILLLVLTTLAILLILPRVKGLFIAAIWLISRKKSETKRIY